MKISKRRRDREEKVEIERKFSSLQYLDLNRHTRSLPHVFYRNYPIAYDSLPSFIIYYFDLYLIFSTPLQILMHHISKGHPTLLTTLSSPWIAPLIIIWGLNLSWDIDPRSVTRITMGEHATSPYTQEVNF